MTAAVTLPDCGWKWGLDAPPNAHTAANLIRDRGRGTEVGMLWGLAFCDPMHFQYATGY